MKPLITHLVIASLSGMLAVDGAPQHILPVVSTNSDLNPYPGKARVVFRSDGTFKLTVFSDLHFGENPWDDWGPEQDTNSTRLMKAVLKDEKPDYVVINGDLITGENTFRENSTTLIDEIVGPLNMAKVPFSSSHGVSTYKLKKNMVRGVPFHLPFQNHDNQANITHAEEILREQKVSLLSYTRMSPPGVGGQGGQGNYWVPIYRKKTDAVPVLILWFFDSRGGFSPGPNSARLPDWVDASVGEWIESETKAMNAVWGQPKKRGALAFVHIPPHIVTDLQLNLNSTKNPGLNADSLDGQGSVQATTDASDSGQDDAFWNALNKNIKNLHAVISGHDHGNEWCSRDLIKDVIFCFNKHSGYGGYTGADWGYGVRNLLFRSLEPRDGVETWIRLEGGETRARITLNRYY